MPGGNVAPHAQVYQGEPLRITQSQTLRVRILRGAEWSPQVAADFVVNVPGDFDGNATVDAIDLDLICAAIQSGNTDIKYDLDADLTIGWEDHRYLVEQVLHTSVGDANLDGQFNSTDLVSIFQAGKYEDAIAQNSVWATGDWNCDGEFTTSDLVAAFQAGTYA